VLAVHTGKKGQLGRPDLDRVRHMATVCRWSRTWRRWAPCRRRGFVELYGLRIDPVHVVRVNHADCRALELSPAINSVAVWARRCWLFTGFQRLRLLQQPQRLVFRWRFLLHREHSLGPPSSF
jgi:hypothetical protein